MPMLRAIFDNLRDAWQYGPAVWSRHFGPNRVLGLRIRGVGRAYIRSRDSDFLCIKQVFSWKEYDLSQPPLLSERVHAKYRQILDNGLTPIIVDAGANIGAASMWFAMHYPEAAVVAIEPDAANVALLQRNVADKRSIRVVQAAIGSEAGRVALVSGPKSWDVQTVRSKDGVEVITIGDAFEASGGDVPFIVKVDIEGFENDLFANNLGWLDITPIVMIEPHDWMLPGQRTSGTFQRAMGERAFEIFLRGENLIFAQV